MLSPKLGRVLTVADLTIENGPLYVYVSSRSVNWTPSRWQYVGRLLVEYEDHSGAVYAFWAEDTGGLMALVLSEGGQLLYHAGGFVMELHAVLTIDVPARLRKI